MSAATLPRLAFSAVALLASCRVAPAAGPPTPEAARAAFRVDPGLRVELVAAEPQVESPVEAAFDEEGRLWVVEMRDYPNGPPPGGRPEGRVKILEDRDGDGRFEHAAVFADGLLFANGLLPWRGGALMTAAPEIALLPDDDRDGRADRREPLYRGFAAENPQLRVSHPTLGLDNWVYVANGLRGGKIVRAGRAEPTPIDLGGMDFRFDPARDRAEAISGMGQFGLTFDAWGRRFVCDNHHHLRHVAMPAHALRRNPSLAAPEVLQDVSELEQGGTSYAGARVYPISPNRTTSSLHAGRFTAACGVHVHGGDLLPDPYRGAAFTCEPTGNLVHMELLRPEGASFRSRPAREGVEFLATADPWFRPVNLATGPDGALYVVDMARAVIEHPEWMPPEQRTRPDLTAGKDRGRIWRIVPDRDGGRSPRPHLGRATVPELVASLGHPNAWWRTTAQRLLLERRDPASIPPLRDLARSAPGSVARVHAGWLLDALDALDEGTILLMARDGNPRVVEHAVRLAEGRLAGSARLREAIPGLADHADPAVRFHVAIALGAWADDRILGPLAAIATAGADDRWTRLAVLAAVPTRGGALLRLLLAPRHDPTARAEPGRLALVRELGAMIGSRRDPAELASALEAPLAPEGDDAARRSLAVLDGLAEGLGRRGTRLGDLLDPPSGPIPAPLAGRVLALLGRAAAIAADSAQAPAARLDATRLLAQAPWEVARPVLARLLAEDPDQAIRVAAARSLAAHARPEVADLLLASWPSSTPPVRRELADALLRQPPRVRALLDAIEAGRVAPGELDATLTRRLVDGGPPELRDRARALLRDQPPQDRRQALDRYRPALELPGDARRGRDVFRERCATCHRVAGVGEEVGPDIGDTRTKTKEMLLGDILDPNRAIDGNFVGYVVATRDGTVLDGVIAAESASSLTLRRPGGKSEVILRRDIEAIRSTGKSPMPEGLEQAIDVPAMADLLAFLKDWRDLDDAAPGR